MVHAYHEGCRLAVAAAFVQSAAAEEGSVTVAATAAESGATEHGSVTVALHDRNDRYDIGGQVSVAVTAGPMSTPTGTCSGSPSTRR